MRTRLLKSISKCWYFDRWCCFINISGTKMKSGSFLIILLLEDNGYCLVKIHWPQLRRDYNRCTLHMVRYLGTNSLWFTDIHYEMCNGSEEWSQVFVVNQWIEFNWSQLIKNRVLSIERQLHCIKTILVQQRDKNVHKVNSFDWEIL